MTSPGIPLGLEPKHWKSVVQILQNIAPQAEVWAFGSRVRGGFHSGSDLDLVVRRGLALEHMVELKNALRDSDLPFLVDVLHWDAIPETFKQAIEQKYVAVDTLGGNG